MDWYYSKKVLWKIIYILWPPVLRLIEILKLHNSRQKFHLWYLRCCSKEDFIHLLLDYGFESDIIAYRDPGQIVWMRKLDTPLYQYHIRLFIDGEIRSHYEYSPEAKPIAHSFEIGIQPRATFFKNILRNHIN